MHFRHISAKIQPKSEFCPLLDLSSARQHFDWEVGGGSGPFSSKPALVREGYGDSSSRDTLLPATTSITSVWWSPKRFHQDPQWNIPAHLRSSRYAEIFDFQRYALVK